MLQNKTDFQCQKDNDYRNLINFNSLEQSSTLKMLFKIERIVCAT